MAHSSLLLVVVTLLSAVATTVLAQGGFMGGGASINTTTITNFGKNPTNCVMKFWKPAGVAAGTKLPMIVAPHYCGANAGSGESWYKLTPKSTGSSLFYVLFPENSNSNKCWQPWDPAAMKHDGGGDTLAVAEMVRYAIKNLDADPARIYITGFSSGASMSSAMAAVYPELFEACASFSGVPPGCIDPAVSNTAGGGGFGMGGGGGAPAPKTCFDRNYSVSIDEWTKSVRGMYPGFTGRYPRAYIVHGDKDELLDYRYFFEEIKIWQGVHGLGSATIPTTVARTKIGGTSQDQAMIEAVFMSGTHALTYQTDNVLKFFGIGVSGFVPPKDADGALPPGGTTPPATTSDPCQTSNGGCDATNGVCSATGGRVTCTCKSGFQLGGDQKTCSAVVAADPCKTNNGGCDSVNGKCAASAGQPVCSCNSGYQLGTDRKTCTAVPVATDPCKTAGCDATRGSCKATNGVATCSCQTGYQLGTDGKTCSTSPTTPPGGGGGGAVVDLCATNNGGCDATNGKCAKSAMSNTVTCSCNTGFTLNTDRKTCKATPNTDTPGTPTDPCANSPCGLHGKCSKAGTGYSCQCTDDYSGNNCESAPSNPCDVVDCGVSGDGCAASKENPRGWVCLCKEGFQQIPDQSACEKATIRTELGAGRSSPTMLLMIFGGVLLLALGMFVFVRNNKSARATFARMGARFSKAGRAANDAQMSQTNGGGYYGQQQAPPSGHYQPMPPQ